MVQRCMEFVHETGVIIASITFDGTYTNFSMAEYLGAELSNPSSLVPMFKHVITGETVFVCPDVCHMLKLIRNCLATEKCLTDTEGGNIR